MVCRFWCSGKIWSCLWVFHCLFGEFSFISSQWTKHTTLKFKPSTMKHSEPGLFLQNPFIRLYLRIIHPRNLTLSMLSEHVQRSFSSTGMLLLAHSKPAYNITLPSHLDWTLMFLPLTTEALLKARDHLVRKDSSEMLERHMSGWLAPVPKEKTFSSWDTVSERASVHD